MSALSIGIHIARWANNKAVGRTNWQAGRQAFDDGDCLRFLETQTVMQNHFVLYFFRDGKLCCCLRDDGDCSKRAELGFSQGFLVCVLSSIESRVCSDVCLQVLCAEVLDRQLIGVDSRGKLPKQDWWWIIWEIK